jgi:hypothetical protein
MPKRLLYRPVPQDFVEVFVRVGWGGIESHYRVHARTVAKWMAICGRDGLVKMRRDYVKANGYKRRERRQPR